MSNMLLDYDFSEKSSHIVDDYSEDTSEIFLTKPQTKFIQSTAKYPLFVAGFGAGKSTTLGLSVLNDLQFNYTGVKIGVYAPTYDLLKLITIPYMEEFLYKSGVNYTLNKSDYIFYLETGDQIIMRSMDNPARIVGYQTFRAHIDEIDTLEEKKASDAWNKIVARNRQQIPKTRNGRDSYILHSNYKGDDKEQILPGFVKLHDRYIKVNPGSGTHFLDLEQNRVSAYSTPEGFRFCYHKWAKDPKPGYEMHKAPTYSNPNLPHDYIQGLRDTYSSQLIDAYIEGEFVNLTSGAVYPDFDRDLNHTDELIKPREALHVGMDFNVNNMSAAIFVIRKNVPHLLDEVAGARDTPAMCTILTERYPGYTITVYPDSSGQNTSSKSASQSDLTILRSKGLIVKARSKNPFVKDRVASVNGKLCNANGHRTFFINTHNCPEASDCLEQQVYDQAGQPDKKAGKDHMNDGIGYMIYYHFPIKKRGVSVKAASYHMR